MPVALGAGEARWQEETDAALRSKQRQIDALEERAAAEPSSPGAKRFAKPSPGGGGGGGALGGGVSGAEAGNGAGALAGGGGGGGAAGGRAGSMPRLMFEAGWCRLNR